MAFGLFSLLGNDIIKIFEYYNFIYILSKKEKKEKKLKFIFYPNMNHMNTFLFKKNFTFLITIQNFDIFLSIPCEKERSVGHQFSLKLRATVGNTHRVYNNR